MGGISHKIDLKIIKTAQNGQLTAPPHVWRQLIVLLFHWPALGDPISIGLVDPKRSRLRSNVFRASSTELKCSVPFHVLRSVMRLNFSNRSNFEPELPNLFNAIFDESFLSCAAFLNRSLNFYQLF